MFMAEFFIVHNIWKQPTYPSTGKCIKDVENIYVYIIFLYGLLQDTEYSYLCYTVVV